MAAEYDEVGRDAAKRLFREAVEAAGGVCAFARLHGRSAGTISDAYADCRPDRISTREISDEMLALAGAASVKRYIVRRQPKAPPAPMAEATA